MSGSPDSDDADNPALDDVLSGAPDRVVDAIRGPELRAELDANRSALAEMAFDLAPVAPSPGLRARIEAELAKRPHGAQRRAVAVLDMIEDYLTPGRPLHVPRAREIIPAVQARIARARADGDPVIYLVDRHEPNDPELEILPIHALAGTHGASVVAELAPTPGDRVIPHRTFSAFFGTDLDRVLKELRVDTFVLTGCATEVGILATAMDALQRGYNVEVPRDCQAGTNAGGEDLALGILSVLRPLAPMPETPEVTSR
jgi:nicotinamidase-related amidase